MSNTPKPTSKPFSLADYASEAEGKPVEFWVDDDTMLSIARPTGQQMFDAEAAMRMGDSKAILHAVCGEEYGDTIVEKFAPLPATALRRFVADLTEKLGLGG